MSFEISNVSLAFPCKENWDKFEVVPGGRLCTSCVHVVKDFRDCSMAELQEAIKDGQHACGRFRRSQLSATFLRATAAVVVSTTVACEPNNITPVTPEPIPEVAVEESLRILEEITFLGIVVETDTTRKALTAERQAEMIRELERLGRLLEERKK